MEYRKTFLKRTPTVPENLSALDRCPPYRDLLIMAKHDEDQVKACIIYVHDTAN